MDKKHLIPLAALLGEDDSPREALRKAAIVLGVDVTSGREILVCGKDTLEEMARGEPRKARVLRIAVDQNTDDLERLTALIHTVKGHDD